MRRLLLISLAGAILAIGVLAYQFVPHGGRQPAPSEAPAVVAGNVRVIPTGPRDAKDTLAAPPRASGDAAGPTTGGNGSRPDVLADVSRTLGELKTRDEATAGAGAAITSAQVDVLKAMAERRHVRPVTRMTFPLEPGTIVPPQVYLHPVPPELAGLASAGDPLGFIQVNDKFVLVGTVSRRIVAVAKG